MISSKFGIVLMVAFVVFISALLFYRYNYDFEKYRTIASPDSRFEIVVYRKIPRFSSMPGQASDAPGYVRLYDRTGHLLHEVSIDMVQRANAIEWHEGKVELPLIFDWELPK